MKKEYDEIMEKIEVTDEMKSRILSRLQEMEIHQIPDSKTIRFPSVRKYLSIAACMTILLTGAFVLPHLWSSEPPGPDYMVTAPNMVEVASAEELSKAVGFEIADIPELPFEPEKITYIAYENQLAEIQYHGSGQTAVFRKSVGNENNSGDHTAYSRTDEMQVGNVTVTLKGNGESYTLAIWSDGEYAYSLNITVDLTAEKWEEIISSIAS